MPVRPVGDGFSVMKSLEPWNFSTWHDSPVCFPFCLPAIRFTMTDLTAIILALK